MRALLFLAIASTLIYKFYPSKKKEAADSLDVKMSSVRREVVKIQTEEEVRAPAVVERFTATPARATEETQELVPESNKKHADPHTVDDSEVAAVSRWNTELKEFLAGVEPEEGEEMYNKYIAESEVFKSEFNNLSNERSALYADENGKSDKKLYQKNRELIEEYDHLMTQMEMNHSEKLKDILGAHYDQVQDMQGQYNDSLREEILDAEADAEAEGEIEE